jgi:transposase
MANMAKPIISKLSVFSKGHEEENHSIGLDVHKRQIYIAVWRNGSHVTTTCQASPVKVLATIEKLNAPVSSIAYESGPTGFGLARELVKAGFNCIVVAPAKVMRPATTGVKTDRLDCIKLAELAAKDLLTSTYIPTEEEESERNIVRRRNEVKKELHRSMQRIKSLLLCLGIEEPPEIIHWSGKAVAALQALNLDLGNKVRLDGLIRDYIHFRDEMATVDAELTSMVTEHHGEEMKRLTSIPGVARIAAAMFLLELPNQSRFAGPEQVANFVGLAPTVRQSGDSSHSCRLVSHGQKQLRSVLVNASWKWLQYDPQAKKLYERMKQNTGMWQKAICAVARKLVIIMWTLLVKNRMYWAVTA